MCVCVCVGIIYMQLYVYVCVCNNNNQRIGHKFERELGETWEEFLWGKEDGNDANTCLIYESHKNIT